METETQTAIPQLSDVVAKEIRIALIRLDWKQSDLAARMGKSEMWVSRRLRGAQPIDLNDFQAFASALGVPLEELLGGREGRLITTGRPAAETGRTPNDRSSRAPGRPKLNGRPSPTTSDPSTVRPVRLRELTSPR